MNTMEITKYVGAFCGALLVFLLIQTLSHALFSTESEEVAYLIPIDDGELDVAAEEPEEVVDVAELVAAADPGSGEGVFRKCAACHKLDGTDGVGPHLNGVVGREIGAIDGFGYSGALPEGVWSEEELYAFLENPRGYASGTSMSFAGLNRPEERVDLIAYLKGLTE